MRVDFHCHSNHSDGQLTPSELIDKAEKSGIKAFSITDHDSISAYQELKDIETNIQIVSGIELSTFWQKNSIHIVGLGFDITAPEINDIVEFQQNARQSRAVIISERLRKAGLSNAMEQLKYLNKIPARPDFAQLLVKKGIVKTSNEAFKKYLGPGKPGDVKSLWMDMKHVINSINSSGGIAVLAHPLYYKLTNSKLNCLLEDFKSLGGQGIEIINGFQNPQKTEYMTGLCHKYNFIASAGSDFHHENKWSRLGIDTDLISDNQLAWIHNCL